MRKIKFRAFYTPDIKMNQPIKFIMKVIDDELFFVAECDNEIRYPFSVAFQDQDYGDWIIQQYTGIKDKNGVEIYEGDILGYPNLNDKTLSEIRWARAYSGEQWCEFRIQNINGDSIQDTEPYDYYGGISDNDYKIVVGNIFVDPTLPEEFYNYG